MLKTRSLIFGTLIALAGDTPISIREAQETNQELTQGDRQRRIVDGLALPKVAGASAPEAETR